MLLANAEVGPYQKIVERNPFGLNPPAAPAPPPPPVEVPKPDVTLTGITSLLGRPKAYLMTKDAKGTPEYLSLSVGERVGSLEVLEIQQTEGKVKIRNAGREISLNFKDNGVKTASAPTPPPPPGTPGAPGGAPGSPGFRGAPTVSIPGRPGVQGSPGGGSTGTMSPTTTITLGAPPTGGGDANQAVLRTIPTRNMRTGGSDEVTVPHPPQANMTAEESAVIMLIQQEANKKEIQQGSFPPLPPVPGLEPEQ